MHIPHRKIKWRNRLFDSTLEANWAASLTVWGVDWVHHPGNIYLSDGRRWEPDFLLKEAGQDGQDILLEVKGEHDANIDKVHLAQQDIPDNFIMIGRSPFSPEYVSNDFAAASWEPTDYLWNLNNEGTIYVTGQNATTAQPGLTFYRALDSSRRIY